MTTTTTPTTKGVLQELSDSAKADKRLNNQFDRALEKIPKSRLAKLGVSKRKRGRPKAGRIVFTKAQIDLLPEYGSIADVSQALQIRYTSLQQWIACGPAPLKFVERHGHKLFRRDVVIKWLIATRRFRALDRKEAKLRLKQAEGLYELAKTEEEIGISGSVSRARKFRSDALALEDSVLKAGFEPLDLV